MLKFNRVPNTNVEAYSLYANKKHFVITKATASLYRLEITSVGKAKPETIKKFSTYEEAVDEALEHLVGGQTYRVRTNINLSEKAKIAIATEMHPTMIAPDCENDQFEFGLSHEYEVAEIYERLNSGDSFRDEFTTDDLLILENMQENYILL